MTDKNHHRKPSKMTGTKKQSSSIERKVQGYLSPTVHRDFDAFVQRNDISESRVVREAVKEYLNKQKKQS